jgi:hypothetical protein
LGSTADEEHAGAVVLTTPFVFGASWFVVFDAPLLEDAFVASKNGTVEAGVVPLTSGPFLRPSSLPKPLIPVSRSSLPPTVGRPVVACGAW